MSIIREVFNTLLNAEEVTFFLDTSGTKEEVKLVSLYNKTDISIHFYKEGKKTYLKFISEEQALTWLKTLGYYVKKVSKFKVEEGLTNNWEL